LARALGLAITRPKSVTTKWIESAIVTAPIAGAKPAGV
jgi:hypothetical protein